MNNLLRDAPDTAAPDLQQVACAALGYQHGPEETGRRGLQVTVFGCSAVKVDQMFMQDIGLVLLEWSAPACGRYCHCF